MKQALDHKRSHRARLMALSYPDKVRIVEQMQAVARSIKAAARAQLTGRR